jgi:hypothetical protein
MEMDLAVLLFLRGAIRILAVCVLVFMAFWLYRSWGRVFGGANLIEQPRPEEPRLPRSRIIAAGKPMQVMQVRASREDVA